MTRRRGKATPKSLRSPPRPPNTEKMMHDVFEHQVNKATARGQFERYREQALENPELRSEYLETFFAVHRARSVSGLTYRPQRVEPLEDLAEAKEENAIIAAPTRYLSVVGRSPDLLRVHTRFPITVGEEFFQLGYRAQVSEIVMCYRIANTYRRGFPDFPVGLHPKDPRPYVTPVAFRDLAVLAALDRQVRDMDSELKGTDAETLARVRLDAAIRRSQLSPPQTDGEWTLRAALFPATLDLMPPEMRRELMLRAALFPLTLDEWLLLPVSFFLDL